MRTLLLLAALLLPTTLNAQFPPWYGYPPPLPPRVPRPPAPPSFVTVGLFVELGFESRDTPTQTSAVAVPLGGIFADFTRHPIRPGIELRGEGGDLGVRGTLVGPRISATYSGFHPYAAALFGPNHFQINALSTPDQHGVTAKAALGLDVDLNPNISWRLIEFTTGSFNGVAGSKPQTFSTGIVLRIP